MIWNGANIGMAGSLCFECCRTAVPARAMRRKRGSAGCGIGGELSRHVAGDPSAVTCNSDAIDREETVSQTAPIRVKRPDLSMGEIFL